MRLLPLALLLVTVPVLAQQPRDPVRIMPLGDSITEGDNGGFRAPLYWMIKNTPSGHPNFVGRRSGVLSDPPLLLDHNHDGYSTYRIEQLATGEGVWGEPQSIEERLELWDPAVVLLHAGTNDVLQDYYLTGDTDLGIPNMVDRLDTLVTRIVAFDPAIYIVVAQIVPITNNDRRDAKVRAFNARLPALVATHQALGERVSLVDMYTPLLPYPHPDGVHPSAEGYQAMAEVWFDGLQQIGLVENLNPGRDDGVRLTDRASGAGDRPCQRIR